MSLRVGTRVRIKPYKGKWDNKPSPYGGRVGCVKEHFGTSGCYIKLDDPITEDETEGGRWTTGDGGAWEWDALEVYVIGVCGECEGEVASVDDYLCEGCRAIMRA
jgi:hypothetical protein